MVLTKHVLKKEFYELLPLLEKFDVEWVVSSQPEGCPEGYTKVYLSSMFIKYNIFSISAFLQEHTS